MKSLRWSTANLRLVTAMAWWSGDGGREGRVRVEWGRQHDALCTGPLAAATSTSARSSSHEASHDCR